MEATNARLRITNTEVILTTTGKEGPPPQILPVDELSIYINGEMINSATGVLPGDEVKLESRNKIIREGSAEIRISPDGMTAKLRVWKRKIVRFVPLDSEDVSVLKPETEKVIYWEDTFTVQQLLDLLAEQQVDYGLNYDAIKTALEKSGEWIPVAEGLHPEPGKAASIEIFFADSSCAEQNEEIQNIDYRDKGVIPSVEPGVLLAQKTPAVPGKPGMSVKGEEIAAPVPADLFLAAGKNTSLRKDGLQIYATALGQPILNKRGNHWIISVEPVYTFTGDVDINSGHIKFDGDVLIIGNVQENMEVHSGKNIEIRGSVTDALIKAEGTVLVKKSIINSRILAGTRHAYKSRVFPYLLKFESTLISILNYYQQVTAVPGYENSRFGLVLDLLVEKKFADLTAQINNLASSLKIKFQEDFSPDIIALIEQLTEQLKNFLRFPYQEVTHAVDLLKTVSLLKDSLPSDSSHKSSIHINYCLNSYLETSGSVIIDGQGCFHTDIVSGDTVEVKGVVRGGILSAQNSVKLNEVGSAAAIVTKIMVPLNCEVIMNQVFENTVISIGSLSYHFKSAKSRVKVLHNQDSGQLEVTHY